MQLLLFCIIYVVLELLLNRFRHVVTKSNYDKIHIGLKLSFVYYFIIDYPVYEVLHWYIYLISYIMVAKIKQSITVSVLFLINKIK